MANKRLCCGECELSNGGPPADVDYPHWTDAKYNSDQFLCFKKDGGREMQKKKRTSSSSYFAVSRAVASGGGAKMPWKKADGWHGGKGDRAYGRVPERSEGERDGDFSRAPVAALAGWLIQSNAVRVPRSRPPARELPCLPSSLLGKSGSEGVKCGAAAVRWGGGFFWCDVRGVEAPPTTFGSRDDGAGRPLGYLGWHGEAGVNAASASSAARVRHDGHTATPPRRAVPCRAELHRAPTSSALALAGA